MVEELYIIQNGERIRLDLNVPSGITLNFKSNIFGDLSKITASYSYTFKLPMSANNRRALDLADDIRHNSSMTRRILKAEFIQNGIPLFTNANLYIESVESHFNAVMTWGIVRGLEAIKDNDLSLKELPFSGLISDVARYGINTAVTRPTDWDNSLDYFIPFRKSEGSYIYNGEKYIYKMETGSSILPVVPIARIIKAINDYYGTTFYFGERYVGTLKWNQSLHKFDETEEPEFFSFGAVPLVNNELTEEQYNQRTGTLSNVEVLDNSFFGSALNIWDDLRGPNVLTFTYNPPNANDYYEIGDNGSYTVRKFTFFKKPTALLEKVEIDGYIKVAFSNIGYIWKNDRCEFSNTDVPKLIVYKRNFKLKEGSSTNGEIVYDEAATLEGTFKGYDTFVDGEYRCEFAVYEFDFRDSNGKRRLEIDGFMTSNSAYPYFFVIDHVVRDVKEVSDFLIVPSGYMSNDISKGYETDIVSNLPDVSCMTFLKSLYYMIGAFPVVNSDGRIVPLYYSDLAKRVDSQDVYDWSNKICSSDESLPTKISYQVSGFAKKNYYLMKNDELEKNDDNKKDDVYENGLGCIECNNETLENNKTIIQLPWFGAFLVDKTHPSYETGKDMKYFKFNDDGTREFVEAKPAIGVVRAVEECLYKLPVTDPVECLPQGTYTMMLNVWNGFKNISESHFV